MRLDLFRDLAAFLDDFDHGLRSQHGVCLSCAGHSVCEDRSIEALSELINSVFGGHLVHIMLRCLYQHLIESERLLLWGFHTLLSEIPGGNLLWSESFFAFEPDIDFDGLLLGLFHVFI